MSIFINFKKRKMDKKLTEMDRVTLISDMIQQAKKDVVRDNGSSMLLWGYAIVTASLAQCFISLTDFIEPTATGMAIGMVWGVTLLLAIVGQVVISIREKREQSAKSHFDCIGSALWLGFGVCVLLTYGLFYDMPTMNYPIILLLYTFAMFMTAVVYKIKSLYISVAVCILCVLSYPFVIGQEYVFYPIPMAVAMIAGNIIPGHVAKINYKRDAKRA